MPVIFICPAVPLDDTLAAATLASDWNSTGVLVHSEQIAAQIADRRRPARRRSKVLVPLLGAWPVVQTAGSAAARFTSLQTPLA